MKRQRMESVLEQLKQFTTVVADTGDFHGEAALAPSSERGASCALSAGRPRGEGRRGEVPGARACK